MTRRNAGPVRLASDPPSPKLRVPAAAKYLGVSPRTIGSRAWRKRVGVPAIKVSRLLLFDPAELDLWLARHAERATT